MRAPRIRGYLGNLGAGVTVAVRDRSSADSGRVRFAPITAVSAAIGLRPGTVSPSAAGIPAAQALLPGLTPLQLAGQRVIYSYAGLTPPAQLLSLIRHGQVAGVIFFSQNVGTRAHLAAVARSTATGGREPAEPRAPPVASDDRP